MDDEQLFTLAALLAEHEPIDDPALRWIVDDLRKRHSPETILERVYGL